MRQTDQRDRCLLQGQLRQAAAALEKEREARAALQLQHEAEMRHLRTEHEASFASADARVSTIW